jgi:hypothetical protein
MLGLVNGIVGVALLLAGRKFFWLFIGALGFITGIQVTAAFWQGPDWLLLIIGLIVGVIFAALATFVQALAIGAAGFLSGGYVALMLVGMLGMEVGTLSWIVYIIGGLIGVVLVGFLFDWAIITLSSFAGASLVTQTFFAQSDNARLIFLALIIVGVIVQGSLLRSEKRSAARE